MKKLFIVLYLVITAVSFAQFKDQVDNRPTIHEGLIRNDTPSLVLGFINPNNFSMHHSVDLSYSAFGNNGMALGVYTNSMFYKFAENLNVQADISLVNSPYNSFGKNFANQINGLYLTKAAINYEPWENFKINIQYRNNPLGYYNPYYGNSRYMNRGLMDNEWLGW
ncbi:MAG: hypothetical protein NTX22_02925 [Ignavibacteriales bacterium]|nr:hypothetical protein [Ignavibacteriales bacterium]